MTLHDSKVAIRLPAQDLERARAFYAEQLGLEPVDERPGGLLYRVGGVEFALFLSTGRPSGEHTQMGFEVADIDTVVADLYPSKNASGERAAWFRDSEGNVLGIGQLVR